MSLLCVNRVGAVADVRLNRAERHNAQTPAMWHELRALAAELESDTELRCVVISGNGKSFSSGLDVRARAEGAVTPQSLTLDEADRDREHFETSDLAIAQEAFRWLTEAPYLTIAAVHGYALGAGAELALACDLRVLADNAQLSLPEAELGMMPDMGGCDSLARLVGYSRAIEIALTCRRIDATEALALGLANAVVRTDELLEAAFTLARTIAARERDVLTYVKRAIRAGADGDHDGSLAIAREGAVNLAKARVST